MHEQIDAHTAHARLQDGWRYLDVRTPQEFAQGRPAGAVNVPIVFMGPLGMRPNPDFVAQVQAHFEPGDKLVIGCKSGGRSLRACEVLARAGFQTVVNLEPGFSGSRRPDGTPLQGWAAAELPVERS